MILGNDSLDRIDVLLVRELQRDCKVPLAKLGEVVGLSAPSVLERVRKLEQAGVILGYHAHIDARSVGLDVTAFIGVSINYPKNIEAFEAAIEHLPEVLECYHVTGAHTLLVKIRTRNTATLEALISKLRGVEGVDCTETMIVLSTQVERVPLHLELPARRETGSRGVRRRRGGAGTEPVADLPDTPVKAARR